MTGRQPDRVFSDEVLGMAHAKTTKFAPASAGNLGAAPGKKQAPVSPLFALLGRPKPPPHGPIGKPITGPAEHEYRATAPQIDLDLEQAALLLRISDSGGPQEDSPRPHNVLLRARTAQEPPERSLLARSVPAKPPAAEHAASPLHTGNLARLQTATDKTATTVQAAACITASMPDIPNLPVSPVSPRTPVCDPLPPLTPRRILSPATSPLSAPPQPRAAPQPQAQLQHLVHPEAAPLEAGARVLAVSAALPAAMQRPVWALEDYQITKRLAKSATSSVYRATCLLSGSRVALKVYFLARMPSNVLHMLEREICIHSQAVHKYVARLYGAFLDGPRVVLVQEYASRGDLYSLVQRLGGRMPPPQAAVLVLRPLLEALAYLHSRGVCHRDVKPENLVLSDDWRPLLTDFGVSIDLTEERAVTRAGTTAYMAPEVARCPLKSRPEENKDRPQLAYSTAVDIWAVGVMAYELMVGFPPTVLAAPSAAGAATARPGAAAHDVGQFVQSEMTAASLHFPASVPPAARAFVLAALEPRPSERPTALQLLRSQWIVEQTAEVLGGKGGTDGGDAVLQVNKPPSASRPQMRAQFEAQIGGVDPKRAQQQCVPAVVG